MGGTDDNTARASRDELAPTPTRYRTQAALLAAIRRGESAAVRQLFVSYAPLLRDQARQMSVPRGERAGLRLALRPGRREALSERSLEE